MLPLMLQYLALCCSGGYTLKAHRDTCARKTSPLQNASGTELRIFPWTHATEHCNEKLATNLLRHGMRGAGHGGDEGSYGEMMHLMLRSCVSPPSSRPPPNATRRMPTPARRTPHLQHGVFNMLEHIRMPSKFHPAAPVWGPCRADPTPTRGGSTTRSAAAAGDRDGRGRHWPGRGPGQRGHEIPEMSPHRFGTGGHRTVL